MNRRSQIIIGINPGTRYLGIAVLDGSELLDWRIKALEGKWSEKKIKKAVEILSEVYDQYSPNVLVLKKLHPSRRTDNLEKLTNKIKDFVRRKGLKVYQYPIKEIEKVLTEGGKQNKRNLFQAIVMSYPELHQYIFNEKNHRNPYYFRALEAVALAVSYSIDRI